MEHTDQHVSEIKRHLRIKSEVTTSVFDDKVKDMGWVKVSAGKIEVCLAYLPGMTSKEATRDFLIEAISLSLKECYDIHPDAFDPNSDLSQKEKGRR